MKSLITILLIAILVSGAVIGLLTMSRYGDCIVSHVAGIACPLFNALAYIGIHANFLRNFSEAFLVIVFSILLASVLFISFIFSLDNFQLSRSFFRSRISEVNNTEKQKQIRWLSLFEKSPTAL